MQRLLARLDASDLQLLTSDGLLKRYSFNARERHCLFVNGGAGRFIEAGYPLGVDVDLEGRGVAVADLDQDGALDLVVRSVARKKLIYFHNEARSGNHFARVDLVGTRSNRDAVGAVVRIAAGGLRQMRLRSAGNGFQAQSEGTLHFGLAQATRIDELTVQWPSGLTEKFSDLPADRLLRIVEGEGRVTAARLAGRTAEEGPPATGGAAGAAGAPGAGAFRAWGLDGAEWRPRPGRPLLVSLWASWCIPCQAEVPVLEEIHQQLGGVEVVAISFEPDAAAARGFVGRNRPRYPVALSSAAAIAPLLERAFGDGAVPLPASVLLDGKGAIAKIFTGGLSTAAVAEAVRAMAAP